MTNAEILAKVILDIELVIAEPLQSGRQQYPARTLEEILLMVATTKVVEAAERVQAGYTGPRLVK